MKTKVTLAACAAALLAFGASAASGADTKAANTKPTSNQCFWARNVDSFAAPDSHTVNIRVGVRDVYRFELLGTCPDIDWSNRIALVSRGSDLICTGMDADIVTHSQIGPQRCPVRSVKKLTTEEIAALGKHARP